MPSTSASGNVFAKYLTVSTDRKRALRMGKCKENNKEAVKEQRRHVKMKT